MARELAPLEITSFVGGLVTDSSPLTFPANSSLDEDNFVLNSDGSRQRRLGMDFENDYQEITTTVLPSDDVAHTSYKWENAGGDPNKSLLVVQFGNEIKFFDLDREVVSAEVIDTVTFDVSTSSTLYSFAVVDGVLVVANGAKDINIFEYDVVADTISQSTDTLSIRDLFGVEDIVDGDNLFTGNNITLRPSTTTDEHTYNLRNQSWGVPRINANTETYQDPIQSFYNFGSVYPSNSDSVTQALYPDANDSDDRNSDRFFSKDLSRNPIGTGSAANGHFIIDAMERGASRLSAYQNMEDKYSQITISITDLPTDKTPGGASIITQFAGRVWYSGFSGEIEGGDSKSPRMSSYVLFSQNVEDLTDIVKCYQEGDPTSKDAPDILDTDGGFIRIDEAYGIKGLKAIQNSLFVIASNGVWRIVGNEDSGFTASGYLVSKVTDRGCRGPKTIIEAEGSIFYWGDDGIYVIARNQFGDWVANSISRNRIQRFYDRIGSRDILLAQGYYDSYEKKARWVFMNQVNKQDDVRELVYDTQLNAFYTNTIYTPEGSTFPKVVGIYESNPFRLFQGEENVTVGGVTVTVGGVPVTVGTTTRQSVTREIAYIAVIGTSPTISYSFSSYIDEGFVDWKSVDDIGVDAPAYLLTGYLSGGDFQRKKSVQNLTVYLRKTESGFDEDFTPLSPSSCKVQAQWEWTNNAASNKFGRAFQAYRHTRLQFPDDVNSDFYPGKTVVVTKNRLRGGGRVLSIKFSTDPGYDCHLYGWSFIIGILTNV